MKIPTLSVIIPVYNGQRYVREVIESVLNQPCKDFELLLLDDGSTDNSLSICKEYESEQVKVYTSRNQGVSKTRNKGIDQSQGKIIIFFDQDDLMKKNFYTEDMRDEILNEFSEGIDQILCGRWTGDEQLNKGSFYPIETSKSGIFRGNDAQESFVSYGAFHQNIYSRNLFFADEEATCVRFLPLSVDVETTFRHMTYYASDKVLFSDKYAFSVRRENSYSISNNWDFLKVHHVRCEAYLMLVEWHKQHFFADVEGIKASEAAFYEAVRYMIEDTVRLKGSLEELLDMMKTKKYYQSLEEYTKRNPTESEDFYLLLHDKQILMKKYSIKVSILDRLKSLYWRLLSKSKKEDDLSSVVG